jgi:type VI protein secretion system component VasF
VHEVPDLDHRAVAERKAAEEAAAAVQAHRSDDVFYANDMNASVQADGSVVFIMRYVTPNGVVRQQELVMPLSLFLGVIVKNQRQITEAARQRLMEYVMPFAQEAMAANASPEDLAAMRRAAAGEPPR